MIGLFQEPSDWRTPVSDATKMNGEGKVKSGSWKRKSAQRISPSASTLKAKESEQATSSSSKFRPGILYSDVLFSGENPNTMVKIRGLTPRQVGSHAQISKSQSRSRKRTTHRDRVSDVSKERKTNDGTEVISLENKEATPIPNESPPKNSMECTKHLMKRLNIDIPAWNFTDFGTFNDIPKFVCQFDDYNYLACEKVAFVGLRLASDGKFKS